VLMVLNLLPLPPLDGGRIAVSLLPNRLAYRFAQIEPYGMMILVVLMVTGVLGLLLGPLVMYAQTFLFFIFGS
jgi:Zn-dependent protease